jgi:hypothetical protein
MTHWKTLWAVISLSVLQADPALLGSATANAAVVPRVVAARRAKRDTAHPHCRYVVVCSVGCAADANGASMRQQAWSLIEV